MTLAFDYTGTSPTTPTMFDSTTSNSGWVTYDTNFVTYTQIETCRSCYENEIFIKTLIKQHIINALKLTWNEKIIYKPIKLLRRSVQLRGVCLDGRGWA